MTSTPRRAKVWPDTKISEKCREGQASREHYGRSQADAPHRLAHLSCAAILNWRRCAPVIAFSNRFKMAEPAQTHRLRHRIDLTREEIDLGKLGPLSPEDSERLLEYLGGDQRDEAVEAWMENPAGPVPWSEPSG